MATWDDSVKTWTAGEVLLASDFNSQIAGPLAALSGAWNSWTTRVDQGASTNIAHTADCGYIRIGSLVIGAARLTFSGTGTSGSAVSLYLPVTAASSSSFPIGVGQYYDANVTTHYTGQVITTSATVCKLWIDASSVGVTPALAVAASDVFLVQFMYEAA